MKLAFANDFQSLVGSQLLKNGLTITISLVVAKYLGVDERSSLALYSSIGLLASVLITGGLPQLAAYDAASLYRNIIPIFFWASLFLALILFLTSQLTSTITPLFVWIFLIYAISAAYVVVIKEILRRDGKMRDVANLFVIEPMFVGVVSLGVLFLFPYGKFIFVAHVIGTVFLAIVAARRIDFTGWYWGLELDLTKTREYTNYIRTNIAAGITLYLPVILITYLGFEAPYIAGFAIAQVFIAQLEVFSNSKVFQLLPELRESLSFDLADIKTAFGKIILLNFSLVIALSVIIWLAIIPILGADYSYILPIFLILSPGVFMSGAIKVSNIWFNIRGFSNRERLGTELRMVLIVLGISSVYCVTGNALLSFSVFPLTRFLRLCITVWWLSQMNQSSANLWRDER